MLKKYQATKLKYSVWTCIHKKWELKRPFSYNVLANLRSHPVRKVSNNATSWENSVLAVFLFSFSFSSIKWEIFSSEKFTNLEAAISLINLGSKILLANFGDRRQLNQIGPTNLLHSIWLGNLTMKWYIISLQWNDIISLSVTVLSHWYSHIL